MKTMTCKQLGGACDMAFHEDSLDAMADANKRHAMELIEKGDEGHAAAMKEMEQTMQNADAMQKYMDDKQKVFDELPED